MAFKVLIIGGGIGGLCLAQGLKKAGIEVELYERDRTKTERLQGYRIRISDDGLASLKECLPSELYAKFLQIGGRVKGSYNPGFSLLDPQLSEIFRVEAKELSIPMSRITLRNALMEGLEDVIHFNKRFTRYSISPDGKSVTAYFDDGTTAEGNLLVGADGGNSNVRHQLLPEAQRIDTGVEGVAARVLLTPEVESLFPECVLSGPTFVSGTKPNGLALFLASYIPPSDTSDPVNHGNDESNPLESNTQPYLMWCLSGPAHNYSSDIAKKSPEEQLEEVKLLTEDWHPNMRALIERGAPSTVSFIKFYTSVKTDPWESTIVTLIGDAIHTMTPYRGNGGNQAIVDAGNLRAAIMRALESDPSQLIPEIHAFEDEMIQRGFKWVSQSLAMTRMIHREAAWQITLRNLVLRGVNLFMNPKKVLFGIREVRVENEYVEERKAIMV